jgi:hypothetical protein
VLNWRCHIHCMHRHHALLSVLLTHVVVASTCQCMSLACGYRNSYCKTGCMACSWNWLFQLVVFPEWIKLLHDPCWCECISSFK